MLDGKVKYSTVQKFLTVIPFSPNPHSRCLDSPVVLEVLAAQGVAVVPPGAGRVAP